MNLTVFADFLDDRFLKGKVIVGAYTVNQARLLLRDPVWVADPLSSIPNFADPANTA